MTSEDVARDAKLGEREKLGDTRRALRDAEDATLGDGRFVEDGARARHALVHEDGVSVGG